MSEKLRKGTQISDSSENRDWVDITVDINDGWADDVSLIYPEGSWKPDDGELTKVDIPVKSKKKKRTEKKANNINHSKANKTDKTKKKKQVAVEVVSDPTLIKKEKKKLKIKLFRVFLIIWLGLLSISIGIGLNYFYNFAEDYERVYQESRPYHLMDEVMTVFHSHNIDEIYQMMDFGPAIGEFETDQNVENYIAKLLEDAQFDYVPTANYLDDLPEYYVTANDYIVATVALRKNPNEYLDYGFPTWYLSSFDFYTEAQHSCKIMAPNNCKVYINGIHVPDDYLYQRAIKIDDQKYFGDYIKLPGYQKYECTDMYEQPIITATNSFGEPLPISFNEKTGMYEFDFGEPSEKQMKEMQNFAINLASTYANYVSHDVSFDELEAYFVPECYILDMIKTGVASNYFSTHTTPIIADETIVQFTAYSPDAFVCEVSLNQYMKAYARDEVVNTDLTFYIIRDEEGDYKCCNIQY